MASIRWQQAPAVGAEERERDGGYWLPVFVMLKPGLSLDNGLRRRIADAQSDVVGHRATVLTNHRSRGRPTHNDGQEAGSPAKAIAWPAPCHPSGGDRPAPLACCVRQLALKVDATGPTAKCASDRGSIGGVRLL